MGQNEDAEKIKELLMRTHRIRRTQVLGGEYSSAFEILKTYPILKQCSYVSKNSWETL